MDFDKAAALATAWVEILCDGRARIVRESTIAKPYGWIFFYQSKEFLDNGTALARFAGNAPIIVNRNSSEIRVTGTAKPLKHYLEEYEKTLPPVSLQQAPQLPRKRIKLRNMFSQVLKLNALCPLADPRDHVVSIKKGHRPSWSA
jgi:hypothetical protein